MQKQPPERLFCLATLVLLQCRNPVAAVNLRCILPILYRSVIPRDLLLHGRPLR